MKKVCLDAGHGGSDPGAISSFNGVVYQEKDAALKITLGVEKYLNRNFVTVMTRMDDTFISLGNRVKVANDTKCDLFVSIHLNAHHSSASGFEIFYASAAGKKIAQPVYDAFVKKFPKRKKRGIKQANFYVLKNTKMPAILIEVGFITNQEEAEWIYANLDDISKTIAKAIEDL